MKELKKFSGAWTVYRRREDQFMWERFERRSREKGLSPSALIAQLAREWVAANGGTGDKFRD